MSRPAGWRDCEGGGSSLRGLKDSVDPKLERGPRSGKAYPDLGRTTTDGKLVVEPKVPQSV